MSPVIGLTGDVMLGRLVDEYQRRRPATAVWGDMLTRLRQLDGLCINLECCLSTRGTPWTRTYRPFHFQADPKWATNALNAVSVDWCALANNHVLDFGVEAMVDTVRSLESAGISSAGVGRTRTDAFRPSVLNCEGLRIGCLSVTDNTPEYAASETSPGTAHISISLANDETKECIEQSVSDLRNETVDLIIASLHWGPNMMPRPPDNFRRFARWLIDSGVDVVHGHSAHIFQGIEISQKKPILYDTGDFLDDYAVDPDLHNDRSFLFKLQLTRNGSLEEVQLKPTEIYDCAVHSAGHETSQWAIERMNSLSSEFGTTIEHMDDGLRVPL